MEFRFAKNYLFATILMAAAISNGVSQGNCGIGQYKCGSQCFDPNTQDCHFGRTICLKTELLCLRYEKCYDPQTHICGFAGIVCPIWQYVCPRTNKCYDPQRESCF